MILKSLKLSVLKSYLFAVKFNKVFQKQQNQVQGSKQHNNNSQRVWSKHKKLNNSKERLQNTDEEPKPQGVFKNITTNINVQANSNKSGQQRNFMNKKMLPKVKFNKQSGLKAIDQVNKYFQGIRMNTKYAKFYNEDKIANINSFQGMRKINDLPFKLDNKVKIQGAEQKNSVAIHILKKLQKQQLNKHLQNMAEKFFTDLFQGKRETKIQPNFQRQARRVVKMLTKNGYNFKLTKSEKTKVQIKHFQLFRGLQVTRNNNYSVDSYQILKQPYYTYYKLWQKGSYKIPEQQWNTQKNILFRIIAKVDAPFIIQISKVGEPTITVNHAHVFVFQSDLKKPPKFSQFSLNQEKYLKAYEPRLQDLTITNVDQRNIYGAFTFEQNQKKDILINKLL